MKIVFFLGAQSKFHTSFIRFSSKWYYKNDAFIISEKTERRKRYINYIGK